MSNSAQVLLISESRILTDLMNRFLNDTLSSDILHCNSSEADVVLTEAKPDLVVIDLATTFIVDAIKFQKQSINRSPHTHLLFVNANHKLDLNALSEQSERISVCYADDSLHCLSEHLQKRANQALNQPRPKRIKENMLKGKSKALGLTFKEGQVLIALLAGDSNQQIGEKLYVSESTIKTHLYRAYRKMGVTSRSQAIVWVQNHLL